MSAFAQAMIVHRQFSRDQREHPEALAVVPPVTPVVGHIRVAWPIEQLRDINNPQRYFNTVNLCLLDHHLMPLATALYRKFGNFMDVMKFFPNCLIARQNNTYRVSTH